MMKSIKKLSSRARVILIAMMVMLVPSLCFATGETATQLEFNFDTGQMFMWTNTILSALMPILYITMGVGLAFLIVNALKRAFG